MRGSNNTISCSQILAIKIYCNRSNFGSVAKLENNAVKRSFVLLTQIKLNNLNVSKLYKLNNLFTYFVCPELLVYLH